MTDQSTLGQRFSYAIKTQSRNPKCLFVMIALIIDSFHVRELLRLLGALSCVFMA